MTNQQCYCYSVKALDNILNNNGKLTPDSFYFELYSLWDIYGEKTIEDIVTKELFFDKIYFEAKVN